MTDPTNPAPPAEELREVTQSDREAAANVWQRFKDRDCAREALAGGADSGPMVQAFARHRLDHLSVLTVENERLRAALEPFGTIFPDTFIADDGWSGPMNRERIVDWFGPSDFIAARAALSSLPAMKGEG